MIIARFSILYLFLFPLGVACLAQNQTVNGDHEIYTPAPSTPDPNNFCFRELYAVGAPTYPNQPLNPPGIASASSTSDHNCVSPRSGKAHGGYFHSAGSKFENLEYQLCSPLIPGEEYDISIWIQLRAESGLASDLISFWFTDWGYYANAGQVEAFPDYRTPPFNFYSESEYKEIKFKLTATKVADALVVGNMFNTDTPNGSNSIESPSGGNELAYYYVDDLVVRPIPRLIAPEQACEGELIQLFLTNRPACSNPPAAIWEISSIDSVSILTGDTIQFSRDKSFSVRVLLPEDTLIHDIEIISPPSPFIWPDVHYLCAGDTLSLDGSFDGKAKDHLWNTGETNSSIQVVMPGLYSFTFSDSVCSYFRSTNVALLPEWEAPLWPDTVLLCPGEQIILSDNLLMSPFTYNSSDGQSGDTLTFNITGTCTITLDPAPCNGPWTQTLHLSDLSASPFNHDKIPNVFTPNGDGTNDQFILSELKDANAYVLTIYNRWGVKVFQSTNPLQGWDGTQDGQDLPADTYAFVVEARLLQCGLTQMRTLRGEITLVR